LFPSTLRSREGVASVSRLRGKYAKLTAAFYRLLTGLIARVAELRSACR
jgi:hypothetical protein